MASAAVKPALEVQDLEQVFRLVSLAQIVESKTNPRRTFEPKGMADLIASVKEKGILVPLLVRPMGVAGAAVPPHFELIAGARRYRAAKAAELSAVPCIVRQLDDCQALEVQVIENLQRADVHPIEEADGYQALLGRFTGPDRKERYNVAMISAKVGKSESYIYQRLKLAELIEPAKKAFLEESITAGHAILIARLPPKEQEKAVKECNPGWDGSVMSVRGLSKWIEENVHLVLKNAAFPLDDSGGIKSSTLLKFTPACVDCPKRTGNNPQLFADLGPKDVCTDPKCFHQKEQKFVDLQLYTNPGSVGLSVGSFYGWKQKGLTGWTATGKRACKDARTGIVVEIARYHSGQERLGQLINICSNARCKVHAKAGAGGADRSMRRRDAAEIARDKREEEKRELQERANLLGLVQIAKKTKTLGRREMELLVWQQSQSNDDVDETVFSGFKWGYEFRRKPFEKLADQDLISMLVYFAHLDGARGHQNGTIPSFKDAADRAGVDLGHIRADLEASAKSKLQTSAKAKKGKAAA